MENNYLFLSEKHPLSKRFVVFEEYKQGYLLYLTSMNNEKPVADIIVFAKFLVSSDEVKMLAQNGLAPGLTKDYATKTAILTELSENNISFKWTKDGEAVLILISKKPQAFLIAKEKTGYSKAIGKNGPFGKSWNQQVFKDNFKI